MTCPALARFVDYGRTVVAEGREPKGSSTSLSYEARSSAPSSASASARRTALSARWPSEA